MTIALANSNPVQYAGNGSGVTFGYPWKISASTDLIVGFITGTVYVQQTSGYTVAGVGNNGGGSITFAAAPPLGTTVDLRTQTPEVQPTEFANLAAYLPENTTNAVDRLTRMVQDLTRQTYTYGIHGPDNEVVPWPSLSSATVRANTGLVFDPSGLPTNGVLPTPPLTAGLVGQFLYPVLTGETVVNSIYPYGDLRRYGGDPTGVSSSWAAFKNAAAFCRLSGLTLVVPPGEYLIDTVNGSITLQYVTVKGTGANNNSSIDSQGSVLNITGTSNTPFNVQAGVTFDGIVFYYPNQVTDGANPTAYPLTLTFDHTNGAVNYVYIQNCTVINAYRFLGDANISGGLGHIFILDNTIYGILTCIEIAYNDEIITISGNEFTLGTFAVAQLETNPSFRYFTRNNGSALLINRSDGMTITDNFFFAYKYGIQYAITTGGKVQQTQIQGNGFDQCQYAIAASGAGLFTLTNITGNLLTGYNDVTQSVIGNAINISTTGTGQENINVTGNTFSIASGDEILISGNSIARSWNILGNTFTQWGIFQATGTYSAINVTGVGMGINVSGNTFSNAGTSGCVTTAIRGLGSIANINNNNFVLCGEGCLGLTGSLLSFSTLTITGNTSVEMSGGTYDDNISATTYFDVGNQWQRPSHGTTYAVPLASWTQAANDLGAASATPPVPIGGLYYNTTVLAVTVRLA